jgi:hypothetical protein
MSTICKLDLNVRLDRTLRRLSLRNLHKTIRLLQLAGNVKQALTLGMIVTFLEEVRKLSGMPGWLKEHLFQKHLPRTVHA